MRGVWSGLFVALGFAGPAFAVAPEAQKLVTFSSQARVAVDSAGKVATVVPDPALPAAVGQAIRDTVGHWRFAPPMKDGKAVAGVTFVQLGACAVPEAQGGNYRFAVAYQGHGPARQGPFPRFPSAMMRERQAAKIRVIYRVLADGSAQIDDIQMTEGRAKYLPVLRQSIQDWIGGNTFQPEQLDGAAVTTKMTLPVMFQGGGTTHTHRSMASARKHFEKEAQKRAAESRTCQAAMSPANKPEQEMALDSPFRFLPQG